MKYFIILYKSLPLFLKCSLGFWMILVFTNNSIAQNQFDIRWQLSTIDCNQRTACFEVQIRSANGQTWGLAGQNYRIYYDGNLASFQSGTSQLDNAYSVFNLRQDEQNLNASTTNNTLNFENNLSFLNYQIDLNNPELAGIYLNGDGAWLTTSQLCFDIDESLINDSNTCLEAIWARNGLTHEYATSFVEISEWVGNCESRRAIGVNFDDLDSGDGDVSCLNLSCQTVSPPTVDNSEYDIRFQAGEFNCINNTICYDVQLRNPTGEFFNLAGQNYRLFYNGSVASFQSGISLLDNHYHDFTVIENLQNQNTTTINSNLDFESNLSFLNYSIELEEVMSGGVDLPIDGTWLTTSQLCFQISQTVINDPNICLEVIWARDGLTHEYATSFVEVSEWIGECQTISAAGVNFDDLDSTDGQDTCFDDVCPVENTLSYDIRLEGGDLDCQTNTICYEVQLRNPTGEVFNLAGQNYRLYYDGSVASWQSGISLLDNTYQDFTLVENLQNQNTTTTNSNLDFESNLSLLNYTIDLNEVMTGGVELPIDGTWLTTSELCFEISQTAINDPNTCLEAIWARDGLTHEYATSFVEVAQWIDMMDTELATGTGYDDLNAADGQGACFVDICTVDTLDLALFKNLANPNQTTITIGQDVVYKIGVINEGNVTVESVTISDNLPAGTALSSADTSNWTVVNDLATKVLEGPLAPGDTLCAYIVLQIMNGSPNQVIFNTAEIIEVEHMNVSIFFDIDSTPNEDDEVNEDDEDFAVITIASCPTIDLANNITICEGGSIQLNPVLSSLSTGIFSWTPILGLDDANSQNPIASPTQTTTYTVTFSDGGGCETSANITVNVGTELAVNITPDAVICANTPFQLTATGGTTYNWSPSEGLSAPNIANPIVNIANSTTYTVTVSDGVCTSTAAVSLTIDSEAPTFNTTVQDAVIDCTDVIPIAPTISATDNSGNESVIQFIENTSPPDICPGMISRIWVATDDCGNQNTMIQSITIIDNEVPVFDNLPSNIDLTCNQTIPIVTTLSATDNCDNNVDIEFMETQQGTDCNQQIIRMWTATDACGNMATGEQIITIQDNEAPVLDNIPADEVVSCDNISTAATPVVTDDCDTNIDLTFNEQQNGTGCNYQLIRTWTATDNCGNTTVETQNIQVQDNTAPSLINVPADLTVSCGNPIPTITSPIAIDNCDTDIPVFASETTIPNDCGFVILRSWSATDDCGNTAMAEQSVFVSDVGQPIFSSSPADLSISCEENIPIAAILTAENECNGNSIAVAFEENTISDDCGQTITRTWSAIDDCGNIGMTQQTIMVMDIEAPILSNIPLDLTIECGVNIPIAATPIAIDACDDNIIIDFEETQTGTNCNQQITRLWTATDNCGNLVTAIQIINIQDNTAPILTGIPENLIVDCGDIPTPPNPIVTDNCDTNVDIIFNEQQNGEGCDFTLTRTWTVTDDCGNTTVEEQLIQFQDNSTPVFTSDFPDIAINCTNGQGNIPFPTATDDCDNEIEITFEETIVNGNCATGLHKIRTWIATDNCSNTITATQNISIQDDGLPILGGIPADITLNCDDVLPPASPIATDNCDTNVEVIFEEVQIGTDCDYTLTRTWTAVDDCGNSVSESQNITLNDTTPPIITPTHPSLTNVSSGDTIIMQCGMTDIFGDEDAIATDGCDSNPLIELKEGDILISTCAEDDFLVWMECYWEATDACGNVSQFLIFIKVVDTTLPQFAYQPMNLTIKCDDPIPPAVMPSVSDNCSPIANIQIIEEENIIPGDCEGTMTIIRTWTAIDECGNSNNVTQTIIIEDNLAPEILGNPDDLVIDESVGETVPVPPLLTATDGCDSEINVIFNESVAQGNCERTIVRTWTATDDCGNTHSVSQTIFVQEDCNNCVLPVADNIMVTPTICNQSTGTATINLVGDENDYTYTWIPNFGTPNSTIGNARSDLPAGNYLVTINYQGQEDCEDKVEFTIEDDCPEPPLPPFQITDFEVIGFKCETSNPTYCLEIPFDEINDFTITVNNEVFDDISAGCDFELSHSYSLASLPMAGNAGNFVVDSWIVDNQNYNFAFNTTIELVDFMNDKDPEGLWSLNQINATVTGEITGKTYDSMKVRHTPTGVISMLSLNSNSTPLGTQLNLSLEETHQIVVTRNSDEIADTLQLTTTCVTTDTIYGVLELGQMDTMCLSKEELVGELRVIKQSSISNTSAIDVAVIDEFNACIICQAESIGTEKSIIILCDEYDVCDTTYLITEVRTPKEHWPIAEDDAFYLLKNATKSFDILDNDTQLGIEPIIQILENKVKGELNIESATQMIEIISEPDYCNEYSQEENFFTYQVCNALGCDTASVFITTLCEEITIYSGFSPNGDGINDHFVIEGLTNQEDYALAVFNRWGNQVFQSNDYQNDWDGSFQGEALPEGTYFYVLKIKNQSRQSGYVQISR